MGGDLDVVPHPFGDGDHGSQKQLSMNDALIGYTTTKQRWVNIKDFPWWKPLTNVLGGDLKQIYKISNKIQEQKIDTIDLSIKWLF